MLKNIGSTDKIIRLVLGTALLGYGIFDQNWIGLIGLVPILTALINTCPLYSLIGINTCPANSK